jgi:hypothetical protein
MLIFQRPSRKLLDLGHDEVAIVVVAMDGE